MQSLVGIFHLLVLVPTTYILLDMSKKGGQHVAEVSSHRYVHRISPGNYLDERVSFTLLSSWFLLWLDFLGLVSLVCCLAQPVLENCNLTFWGSALFKGSLTQVRYSSISYGLRIGVSTSVNTCKQT